MLKEKISICQKYDCKVISQIKLHYIGLLGYKNSLSCCFDNYSSGLGFVVVETWVGRMGSILGIVGWQDWVPEGQAGNLHLTTWAPFL